MKADNFDSYYAWLIDNEYEVLIFDSGQIKGLKLVQGALTQVGYIKSCKSDLSNLTTAFPTSQAQIAFEASQSLPHIGGWVPTAEIW